MCVLLLSRVRKDERGERYAPHCNVHPYIKRHLLASSKSTFQYCECVVMVCGGVRICAGVLSVSVLSSVLVFYWA
jgi:hypothetical protein